MKKIIWKRRWIIWIYSSFSYCSNALWLTLDLLPHFLRVLLFRIIFRHFGHDCLLDYRCYVRYPWRVSIGNNVAINRGCELYSSMKTDKGLITLEDHVTLGPGVTIFSATHDYSSLDLADISERVIIGRYSWIGGKTIILPGVVIGEGAVVGAGSIVTKNIPPFSIAVGNPAKVINTRSIV